MKHHKSVKMYGPTMQSNIKTYYQMFRLSLAVPNLCPQPKLSVVSCLISDHLQDA